MKFLSLLFLSILLASHNVAAQNQTPAPKTSTASTEKTISSDKDAASDTAKETNKNEELLSKAYKSLRNGNHQEAIDKYLNPIIADFEVTFKEKTTRVYSARSTAETLLYLLPIAISKKDDSKGITKAIVVEYFWADAFFLKGNAYVSLGKIDESKKWIYKALELSPNNATFISELGFVYQAEKKFEAALKLYERAEEAIVYSPDNLKNMKKGLSLRGAGYCLIELGRIEEAEQKYFEALKIDPEDNKSKAELKYIKQLRKKTSKK